MSTPSSTEKSLQNLADEVLGFLITYTITFWAVLRHPSKAVPALLSDDPQSQTKLAPGAFLIANILLVFIVKAIVGIKPAEFPVQLPWIADFPLAVLKYLLGVVVISGIIVLVVSRGEFPRGIVTVAPAVCYASVVYLPLSLMEMRFSDSVGDVVLKLMSWVIDKRQPSIMGWPLLAVVVTLTLYGAGVVWWARILHIGVRAIRLEQPYRRPVRTSLSVLIRFVAFKGFLSLLLGVAAAWGVYSSWFQWERLKLELRENPPKCGAMFGLAQMIATDEKKALVYPRYMSNLVAAACYPSFFSPNDLDARQIESVIKSIRDSEFGVAKAVLERYLEDFGNVKTDVRNPIKNAALNHLKKAEELSRSERVNKNETLPVRI